MVILRRVLTGSFLFILSACSTPQAQNTLYHAMGGQPTIQLIVDNFIEEIQFNPQIFKYFEQSDVERFREKISEHLCLVAQGPCTYTGDTMIQIHTGMNINETDFNIVVDLLINAMTKAQVSHQHQNKMLKELAKMRHNIIYL